MKIKILYTIILIFTLIACASKPDATAPAATELPQEGDPNASLIYPEVMGNPHANMEVRKEATWKYMCQTLSGEESPEIREAVNRVLLAPEAGDEIKAEILDGMIACQFRKPHISERDAQRLLGSTRNSLLKRSLLRTLKIHELPSLGSEFRAMAQDILLDKEEEHCVREAAALFLESSGLDEGIQLAIEHERRTKHSLQRRLSSNEFRKTWCPHIY